tara:strand:- start:64 stop:528 length:465 start_codon:yes stop_codon:yes gene_type:complete
MTTPLRYYSAHNKSIDLKHETTGSAGLDLRTTCPITVQPLHHSGSPTEINTGIHVEIPTDHFGLVVPRSSTGRLGLRLANTVGIIDSDYRGPIILMFTSDNEYPVELDEGQRIAQLIICPYVSSDQVQPVQVYALGDLTSTERDKAGFGSTGVK